MKLLIDMNLSPLWIPFLQQNGFEAIHWCDLGAATAPETEILAHAQAGGYVISTHDLDFGRLLALQLLALQRSAGPSVVQIRTQDVLPNVVGQILMNALKTARSHLDAGALVTIDLAQHRIRLLPI